MKNWARKFNPHKTAYRTPSSFKIRKILSKNSKACPEQSRRVKKVKIKEIKK